MLIWHSQLSSPPKAHVKNFSEFGGLDGNAIEDVFIQIFVWDNRWHMYLFVSKALDQNFYNVLSFCNANVFDTARAASM